MAVEKRRRSTNHDEAEERDRQRAPDASDDRNDDFADGGTAAEWEYDDYVLAERESDSAEPDVLLDVPVLKLDELLLEVERLQAQVALQADVLNLLKLQVGANVFVGQVGLEIKGIDAQALLKVRLANVVRTVDRVLTTVDRNPQLLEGLVEGAGEALGELGEGAGSAVEDVGEGAGSAVEDVGEGAGSALDDVGEGAGSAVEDVGDGAESALEDVGEGARSVARGTSEFAGDAGERSGEAVEDASETATGEAREARRASQPAGGAGGRARRDDDPRRRPRKALGSGVGGRRQAPVRRPTRSPSGRDRNS